MTSLDDSDWRCLCCDVIHDVTWQVFGTLTAVEVIAGVVQARHVVLRPVIAAVIIVALQL